MLSAAVVALCLAAAPAPQIKLASPGFQLVNVDAKQGTFFSDFFARNVSSDKGFSVVTASEMETVLGFERQKQLLGCTDASSSCMAELAGALGADGIITGSLGKFGDSYAATVKVIKADNATPLFTRTARLADDQALLDWLTQIAPELRAEVSEGLGRGKAAAPDAAIAAAPEATATGGGPRAAVLVPGIAGGAAVAGGVVLLMLGKGVHDDLVDGIATGSVTDNVQRGQTYQTAGFALIGAGVAAGVVAAVLALKGPEEQAVAVTPLREGGAAIVFAGAWR